MHAQTSAFGFYKKLGWMQVGGNFFEAGIEHVAMTLPDKVNDPAIVKKLLSAQDIPEPLRDYLTARK
jgi:hypothetical protein